VTDPEQLVDDHYVEVYRLALRLLANPDAAMDLTQEVFYRAVRALPRFRGESSPRTWLYRITLNEARRRRARLPTLDLNAAISLPDPTTQTDAAALDAARLHTLIRALPDREREAIVLHHLHGLPVTEVATLLGAGENTTKTWLRRGRERLRKLWGAP
jgi:RNA polymerase sigma-70 factor (ECF subfamily)